MKLKKFLGVTMSLVMLVTMMPVNVQATETVTDQSTVEENGRINKIEEMLREKADIVYQEPIALDEEDNEILSKQGSNIQPRTTALDDYEPNDNFLEAKPYSQVEDLTPKLTNTNQLWSLGMKHAGLHSETDEDWFSIDLEAGEEYFIDLRNIGRMNWYIELYYIQGDVENGFSGYKYTTDPNIYPAYQDKPEKYFYLVPEDSGTFYIRITSGGDWQDSMHYFFYVGPSVQTFYISNMLTMGGVQLNSLGSYSTYTSDLRDAVPEITYIHSLYVTDSFSGTATQCGSVNKCLTAGGKSYYSEGENNVKNITGASLGQVWTIGGACSHNRSHTPYWSARLNGRFSCVMAPYPGNEL